MTKTEIIAEKLHMALSKTEKKDPTLIPAIIGHLLRKYKRYGLADIVETAWSWKSDGWKPPEGRNTNEHISH